MDNHEVEKEFLRKVTEDAFWFFAHRYTKEGLDDITLKRLKAKFETYSILFTQEIKLSIEDAILEEQKFLM